MPASKLFVENKAIGKLDVTAIGFGKQAPALIFSCASEIQDVRYYFHGSDFCSNREAFLAARAFADGDYETLNQYGGMVFTRNENRISVSGFYSISDAGKVD